MMWILLVLACGQHPSDCGPTAAWSDHFGQCIGVPPPPEPTSGTTLPTADTAPPTDTAGPAPTGATGGTGDTGT